MSGMSRSVTARKTSAEIKWDPASGRWYARPYLGTNRRTGGRIRPYKSWPGTLTRSEAQEKCDEWVSGLSPQTGLSIGRTLGDVLESYIDYKQSMRFAPSTIKSYRSLKRAYVDQALEAVDIDEVKPYVVEGTYAVLLLQGGRDGHGISERTVSKLHWMLSGMFRWAVRVGITEANPMPSVKRPRYVPHEATAFDEREMALVSGRLESAMSSTDVGRRAVFARNVALAAYLALHTGARCGEALAVTRAKSVMRKDLSIRIDSSVDASDGPPAIRPCTKGRRGRTVAITEENRRRLDEHVGWQDSAGLVRARPSLTLCCSPGGSLMRPSSVSSAFTEMRRELGLPEGTSFHTLRHTHATWLISQGVDIKTVQERLGHAKISTTLELYAHVLPGRDEMAARAFGELMGGVR